MPGRGPQTFKKRQKEQERKERQMEKMARRHGRKDATRPSEETPGEDNTSELTSHDVTTESPAEGNTSAQ